MHNKMHYISFITFQQSILHILTQSHYQCSRFTHHNKLGKKDRELLKIVVHFKINFVLKESCYHDIEYQKKTREFIYLNFTKNLVPKLSCYVSCD